MELGDTQYGIYWIKDYEIHRDGMTLAEAKAWLKDADDVCPVDVYKVWGICMAQWVLTDH